MLRVASAGTDRSVDVVATVEPTHTVDELRRALAAQAGVAGGRSLARAETGQVLDPQASLGEVGLVSGEVLTLTDAATAGFATPAADALVRIEAVGGPASGWRVELGPGTWTLGRPWSQGERLPHYRAIPDAAISRSHAEVTVGEDLTVTIRENPEATNPLLVDGVHPEGPAIVPEGAELRIGDSVLTCGRVEARPPARVDQLGQVAFHRTPLRPARPEAVVLPPITKVPATPEPARFSWLSSAAPLVGGILMAAALQEPRFLIFVLLAPITGAASWFESRRRTRERHERDLAAFEKRLAERADAYATAYAEEETARLAAAPDIADLRRRAELRDRTLWSRGRDIPEFLRLRAGTGPADSHITAEFSTEGDEELVARLEELAERHRSFERVPVTVPLADLGVLGIHGPRREVASLAKALLIQAVCLHSPEDLVVATAASPEMDLISWLRWVPHTHATGSPIGGPHLAADRRAADQLLQAVLDVAEFREAGSDHGVDRRWPWVLVVLDRLVEPDPHLVAQLLDRCPQVGISVLWLSDSADRIPPQCRAVAELADRAEVGAEQLSKLWFTDPDTPTERFAADGVDRSLPDIVARSLAPLRDASSTTSTSSIPRMVPLFAAHGIDDVTPAWVQQEWAVDRVGPGGYALQTVVGMTADGPMTLDLVSDGPHGLIGGTSGAGKSELVAALVAGLVAHQSPRDLSLLFIDFKGGSASEVFKDLPHVSGRVTDLDESLALRAQVSLRAELRRRVALFSELAAKDMAEMRRLHPDQAPPSLVIVIDEFATLVKQLPDFVADIVDIAQRGRSYGVHLLLATQRPSSSVDDNILANTNLRISLRMLDRAESMSILNAPDAAEIPVPLKGRSIARMGPGQLVEFQSAYCSAPLADTQGRPPIEVAPLGVDGAVAGPNGVAAPAVPGTAEPRTQLDALIDAVLALGHPPVRQIWNELLPEHLPFTAADKARRTPGYERDPGRLVLLGVADDPANQTQHAAVADLESGGGLLVLGTGGSGKTTALRTVAASAAIDDQRAGGGSVAIFVLDFSSGELRALQALPQVCGIGSLDDLEATTRIIETLDAEVGRRRAAGADAAGPTVLLLVDGYANLIDALQNSRGGQEQASDQWLNAFHRVVLDGRQLGVHTVLTADRAGSVRSAIFASMTRRLVLRQPDPAETKALGIPGTDTFGPGAGYLDGLRVQVATLTPDGSDDADTAVRSLAGIIDVTPPAVLAPPLPEQLPPPDGASGDGWSGVVGIADITGEPVRFDVSNLDVLVTGPPLSGKSWGLRSMAEQLERAGRTVYAIGAEDSGLRDFPWKAAAWGVGDIEVLMGTLKAELAFPGRDAVLVVDDLDLLEGMAFDAAMSGFGPNRSVRMLGATTSFGYSGNEVVKRIRAARQVLHLQPASAREVAETIGVMRLPLLRLGLPMPPGRGMFVRNRVPTVVQVHLPADAPDTPRG
ncbi:MAG TPA: FtsK/SpoIIIE domain-containing protein [Acidimicrobiales bacterium]|nr:FtsK/SpoIIIE domain-containing protein [Acidimicrobiales bacterium]